MSKNQEQTKWWMKKTVLIGGALLLIAVVGATIWWVASNRVLHSEPTASDDKRQQAEVRAKQVEDDGKLQTAAAEAITKNNTGAADKLYQQAIDLATTDERKTLLYIDLSAAYYNEGRYDEAFATARKAEALSTDKFLIADWLSRLYEAQEKHTEAAVYYRMAGEYASSPLNHTAMKKAYFDGKANEMTKLAGGK